MDMDTLRKFVKLIDESRRLEADAKAAKEQLEALEETLKEQFAAEGIQNIQVDGYTVFCARQLWAGAKDGDKAALSDALKRCGPSWNFLVEETVNSSKLSARIREITAMTPDGLPKLPPSLVPVINITEKFSIRARRA